MWLSLVRGPGCQELRGKMWVVLKNSRWVTAVRISWLERFAALDAKGRTAQ